MADFPVDIEYITNWLSSKSLSIKPEETVEEYLLRLLNGPFIEVKDPDLIRSWIAADSRFETIMSVFSQAHPESEARLTRDQMVSAVAWVLVQQLGPAQGH